MSPTSRTFSIEKRIELKADCSGFVERKLISKEVIRSFEDMEKLMVLREKLIKFSTHHIGIFGELDSISTNLQSFIFSFKYVPRVALR